jgi:carbon monoxide dehydrogenase subunit G
MIMESSIMQMEDTQRVPAPQNEVWAALNDPEILKTCIPGCKDLVMTSSTEMTATVVVKVGPVKASFSGKVTLSDLDPPNGYRISGEGAGGVAGFAKDGATVSLSPDGPRRDVLALCGGCADWRQAGAARLPPDRLDRKKAGRRVLPGFHNNGRRGLSQRRAFKIVRLWPSVVLALGDL